MGPSPLRVAAVQHRHRASVAANLEAAGDAVAEAARAGARLVLLPEYFASPLGADGSGGAGPPPLADHAEAVEECLRDWSRDHGIVLAAATLARRAGGVANVGLVYASGARVGEQVKVHPMPREESWSLVPGNGFRTFEVDGVRIGVLVCADILYPEAARILALDGVDVVLNPVMSPYRGSDEDDPTRAARESVFVARAWDTAAFVVKAGGTSADRRAVGRSLVAAPWGLLARYRDPWQEEVLLADLDLEALAAFRKTQRGLEARRPAAYGRLVEP